MTDVQMLCVVILCLLSFVLGVMTHSASLWFIMRDVKILMLTTKKKEDPNAKP